MSAAIRELTPCPSEAAFRRHHRKDELACDGCLRAHAEYEKSRAAARKEAA